jgi:hypothetical protein
MLTPGHSREQLREYLHCLSSEKQAALLEGIEHAVVRGENVVEGDLILAELRRVLRNSPIRTKRIGSPSRWFFDPVEPFIVDAAPSGVAHGRVARVSLSPIWIWICNDLVPKEAKSYSDAVTRALGADDQKAVAAHAEAFHALALPRIREALASQQDKNRVRDSLASYMGPPRAITDLSEIITILTIRRALSAVASKLPEHIGALSGEHLKTAIWALDAAQADCGHAFNYALLLVMKRLYEPWQLVRLAVATHSCREAANSPYHAAVGMVIADAEEKLSVVRTALETGETETTNELIEAIGRTLEGLANELDLKGNPRAAEKLDAIRNDLRALLAAEIEAVPIRVKRAFEMPLPLETARGNCGTADIAATERDVALMQTIRRFSGALALDINIASALSLIRDGIERAVLAFLGGLRTAIDRARKFYLLQISHTVRICAKLFGKEYVSAIVAATETAVDDEQRAA